MADRPLLGIADGLCIAPQRARLVVVPARLPGPTPLLQFGLREVDAEDALAGMGINHVAIPEQTDRPAHGGFRSDMADAESPRGAGEAAVRDDRHLVAHALAVDGGGRCQHLAHAGTAARALVADDEDITLGVLAL